ncbi:N-acetylmuramic acid 6-phosphate etherase [Neorhizobium lilium]|uniref:N-acetylmuramic acid 6-phosphate etherase n=1 Tax=Neorhizobium lilium TaxID=2503024 RepID=A0A3S3SC42_9HYPH|nr:N-acetylmuramic acid 6-phosphate etherase [Neorhizobium lilium]RWX76560.1 N-acetylmuramic acid 6-phosphate etherase [Neorhizobium lilium]
MSKIATEAKNGKAGGLDMLAPAAVLELLAAGQQEAAKAVDKAAGSIARAAELVADTLRAGGKLVYVGAGSSGLMALADALELPGTYGIPREQIVLLLAGGISSLTDMEGAPEDDVALAEKDAAVIGAGDCVICVSASGSTPYAVTIADISQHRGAKVIAMANNSNAKLFHEADIRILLETPPELVAGSTRMGAGTAQKIAFNMLSTLAAIKLGHVHDGHMVNLRADNEKLRARAAGMVAEIAAVEPEEADELLKRAGGSVKLAVLLGAGAADLDAAQALLDRAQQVLRPALAELRDLKSSIKRA